MSGTIALLLPAKQGNKLVNRAVYLEAKQGAGKGAPYFAIDGRSRKTQTFTVRAMTKAPGTILVAEVGDPDKDGKRQRVQTFGELTGEVTTYVPGGKDSGNDPKPCVVYSGTVEIDGTTYRPQLRIAEAPQGGMVLYSLRGVTLASWAAGTSQSTGVAEDLDLIA